MYSNPIAPGLSNSRTNHTNMGNIKVKVNWTKKPKVNCMEYGKDNPNFLNDLYLKLFFILSSVGRVNVKTATKRNKFLQRKHDRKHHVRFSRVLIPYMIKIFTCPNLHLK